MPPCITRLLRHVHRKHRQRPRCDLPTLRDAMLSTIRDCEGPPAQRLSHQIRAARQPADLWQLRSDAYHLIALQHCQSIADERLQGLLHLFQCGHSPNRTIGTTTP